MFKRIISSLVVSAVVLAPVLPARADFGVTVGTPFGVSIGTPYGGLYPGYRGLYPNYQGLYPNYRNGVILRSTIVNPGIYSNGFPSSTVIVAPRARTVIINPGYRDYSQSCGSMIFGSPIPSPVPVNPYNGSLCR